jgi:hypothetical protein
MNKELVYLTKEDIIHNYNTFSFKLGVDIRDTMSSNNSLIDINRIFGLDKSTSKNWMRKATDLYEDNYKRILITYLKHCNLSKSLFFQKKYKYPLSKEYLTTLSDISIFFEMDNDDINSFLQSKILWKKNLIFLFQKLNKFLLVAQINIIRKKLDLPIISYVQITLNSH